MTQQTNNTLIWLAIMFLSIFSVGSCLSHQDHYRMEEENMMDIGHLQQDLGQFFSCYRWPNCTKNAFCPDGGWDFGTEACNR